MRTKSITPLLMAMVIVTVLTACVDYDDHTHPELKSGADFFNHHCAECHGKYGLGKSTDVTPDDFIILKNHDEMITSADKVPANVFTLRDHDGIVNYITSNINPQRKMPVFSAMPRSEADAIAGHLIELRLEFESMFDNGKRQPLLIEP